MLFKNSQCIMNHELACFRYRSYAKAKHDDDDVASSSDEDNQDDVWMWVNWPFIGGVPAQNNLHWIRVESIATDASCGAALPSN